MLAAPFLSTTATHVALSRARLLTTCKLSLLLLCAFCCTCCFAAPALAQSAARAASSSIGSDTGFTYQVPEIGPPILGSKAHAATATASQPQPDIQALDVTWSPANPQSGDLVKFSALVTNLGDAPAPQYTVEFYLKNETGEISYWASYWDPQPLNPGESRWVTGGSNYNWGFWAATPGSHIALVDINDSYESLTKMLYVPPAPLSSLTAVGGDGQISLAWVAVSGATSYNLYRSATAGGEGSVPYKTGLLTTSCVDTSVPSGTTYYYTFTAVGAQGESAQSNEASATAQSFGAGRARFYPHVGYEGRMLGGKFQGSNDGTSYTDLATVTTTPSANQYTQQALSADPKLFRYLRYLSPSGGYCDIAELEFYSGTSAVKLTGTLFGSPGTWDHSDYNAFDNDPNSFFDAPVADGAYVGLRQSALSPFTLTATAGAGQISLSWTGVGGASGYNVRRGLVSGGPYTVIAPGCSGTSYTDTNVASGTPYYYIVTALSSGDESAFSNEAIAKIGSVLAPYSGSPLSVAARGTTTIEAENYDLGGQGIAFNDIDNGNQSGYRSDNIGVAPDGNASNGYVVGWAQGGEWDGYTLNVAAAGSYALTARVACPSAGGMFHVEFGPLGQVGGAGIIQSGEFTVPNTGSWGSYQDISVPAVRLPAGPLWMRLVLDYGGSGRYVGNFDAFSLTPVPPAAPTGLVATADRNSVSLAWNPVDGATTYNIYRSTSPGGEGAVPFASNVDAYWFGPSYYDDAVRAGVTYYYQVTAVGDSGEGAKSNEASATPGATPLPAPLLKGVAGASQNALTWSAITGSSSYNLYRSNNTDGYPGGYPGYGTLYRQGLTGTAFTDTGLTNGTQYNYYVAAVSVDGQGSQSNTVSLTPGSAALAAPLLSASTSTYTSNGQGSISLTWAVVAGATSYDLYRSTTPGGEGATPYKVNVSNPYQLNAPNTSYSDSGLPVGTTYYYRVVAVGPGGEGAFSNEASATVGTQPLPAPTNFTATAASHGGQSIALTWGAVMGATIYNLYRSVGPGSYPGYGTLYQQGLTGTSYTDTNVGFGPTYSYYVCAVNTSGQGNYSNSARATLYGFGISASPTPVTVTHGTFGAIAITLTPSGGYTGPITLTGSGLPTGLTAWFYPGSVTLPTVNNPPYQAGFPSQSANGTVSSNLMLVIPASVAPGTYTLGVTGSSTSGDGFTNTVPVTLTIN